MDNLSVVIPFFNGHSTIFRLLDSLPPELPVVVVDDLSDEPLSLGDYPRQVIRADFGTQLANAGPVGIKRDIRVIRPDRKGYFSGAVNVGLEATDTDVLVLNQDVWFEGDRWLDELSRRRKRCDLTGDPVFGHPAWPQGYVQGTLMYLSRRAIAKTGGLNEKDYPLWGSTCEWQLRACRLGFKAEMWADLSAYGFRHQQRRRGSYGSAITEILEREPERKRQFIRTPPAVSVIIPCYNYGRFLSSAIGSLIGGQTDLGMMAPQSLQSFEIIIVDDASQDDSAEIARSLADPWQGIRAITLPQNRGTAGAINAGIEAAYGRFVTVLSADDMREPWSLEALYRVVEADPKLVAYDDLMYFANGKRRHHQKLQDYDFERLLLRNQMHAGILYARDGWKAAGGYPERMKYGREDWAINVALGINGYCGQRIPRPGYLYRREKHNRSLRNGGQVWRERFLRQMQAQFPAIYEGERPMPCCGGRVVPAAANGGGAMIKVTSMPGQNGMILIEYIGRNAGDENWFPPGPPVVEYVFGGAKRTGYVDKAHAEWFLNLKENGRRLFQEAKEVAPDISEAEAMAVNPPAPKVAATASPPAAAPEPVKVPNPNDLTVTAIRALDLPPEAWEQLLEAERLGKNRSTAISYAEAQIAAAAA